MTIKQLETIFKDIDENKKRIVESMYEDFIHEQEMIEKIKTQLKKVEEPKNQKDADKLKYFTKIYSDISQRHDSKIKIFLSALSKFEMPEDNPITAWLKEKKNK